MAKILLLSTGAAFFDADPAAGFDFMVKRYHFPIEVDNIIIHKGNDKNERLR